MSAWISRNVVILTTKELEEIKDEAFRKGVERGRFEERSDTAKLLTEVSQSLGREI